MNFVPTSTHFEAKNQGSRKTSKPLKILVFASGFEPLAYRLGGGRSILLSYANRFDLKIIPLHYQLGKLFDRHDQNAEKEHQERDAFRIIVAHCREASPLICAEKPRDEHVGQREECGRQRDRYVTVDGIADKERKYQHSEGDNDLIRVEAASEALFFYLSGEYQRQDQSQDGAYKGLRVKERERIDIRYLQ